MSEQANKSSQATGGTSPQDGQSVKRSTVGAFVVAEMMSAVLSSDENFPRGKLVKAADAVPEPRAKTKSCY
jgi:hypothetical protein